VLSSIEKERQHICARRVAEQRADFRQLVGCAHEMEIGAPVRPIQSVDARDGSIEFEPSRLNHPLPHRVLAAEKVQRQPALAPLCLQHIVSFRLRRDVHFMLRPDARRLDPREEHFWMPGPRAGFDLFLRHLEPAKRVDQDVRPVLYVHGATFPSALSVAHRFDGRSWRDALCEAGFDVWALDFYGYGYSARYAEMSEPPDANPPLLRAQDASTQVEAAVCFILDHHGLPNLSIISHSWGSIPTCLMAGEHPTLVERIVLFAPIARRHPRRYEKPPSAPAWRFVSLEDQWTRFVEDQPRNEPPVLSKLHFEEWGERYLDSDEDSRTRSPASVKIPTGPFTDIMHAWHGELAYEIGLRHHRSKKNKTDDGHTLNHIRGRDLIAFCAAIVVPMRPFLARKGHPPEIVNRMYDAWMKSMILQATLWTQPYMREGDF
jgi:pimeloyl-ACP methyl ester carboxylesterase